MSNAAAIREDYCPAARRVVSGVSAKLASSRPSPVADIDFVLTPPTESDIQTVATLATDRRFLFAPFNDAIRDGWQPRQIARQLIFGTKNTDYTLSVRDASDNSFLGLVSFTNVTSRGRAEISYFFVPSTHRRGLGRAAVFAAMEATLAEKGYTSLVASVDPGNTASVKILKRGGVKKYMGDAPETAYRNSAGKLTPRIFYSGHVINDIKPALETAKAEGYFKSTPVIETNKVGQDYAAPLPRAAGKLGLVTRRMDLYCGSSQPDVC